MHWRLHGCTSRDQATRTAQPGARPGSDSSRRCSGSEASRRRLKPVLIWISFGTTQGNKRCRLYYRFRRASVARSSTPTTALQTSTMPSSQPPLAAPRELIDDIDNRILDLLQQRNRVVGDVIATKIRQSLPIFDAAREADKIVRFRAQAVERGLDAEWAEDFLRMIMGSSRDRQSHGDFPRAGSQPR
ncbi:MAG: chorismate mutase, partial [Metallibacterium scheffleri]